ncbi:VOC family protein [Desulfocurvibacter africanus]|uniref:VOC family protein n=1 Tax=Desulfocurvibacter africanus TaxID=873 RepID=UPI0003F4CE05|nr:VOC family protein [Desulfocurvibacter africanus]
MAARVIHFEIPARDPERANAFYSGVFGWDVRKWEGPEDYWLLTTGPDEEPGINGDHAADRPERHTTGGCACGLG